MSGSFGGFDVGAVVGHLLLDKEGWTQSAAAVQKELKAMGAEVSKIGKDFVSMGKMFAVAGGAITAGLAATVKMTADFGDAINDMSKRTGISTELLSGYKLAAEKSGTSIEGLAIGMRGLASNMQAGAVAGSAQNKMFDALGVTVMDNAGKLRLLNDVMLDVSDRFTKMQDGATKTALAQDIFGRSGMELIPLLNLGAAGLREEAEAASRLGLVISKETARAADEFNDSLAELKASVAGVGMTIGNALMPTAKSLSTLLTGLLSGVNNIARENFGLTQTVSQLGLSFGTASTIVGTFGLGIGGLLKVLGSLAVSMGTTKASIAASMGLWTALATAVGFYIIKLGEKAEAEALADKANDQYWKTYERFRAKLLGIASAAGLNVYQFNELTAKYGENINALALAIKKGDEGVAMQKAMAEIGARNVAEFDRLQMKALGLAGGIDKLTASTVDAVAAFSKLAEANLEMMTLDLQIEIEEGTGVLNDFVAASAAAGAALSDQATKDAQAQLASFDQITSGVMSCFTSMMDGSKAMGEFFSSIVTTMIGDIGRLVFAELAGTLKIILAKQMESVAYFIASAFKHLGIFAFPVAAGAFALVSGLFKKLLKFEEGGVFNKPTIAEVGHGTEYVLPEKKLINIVRDAMGGGRGGGPVSPQLALAAAAGGGQTVTIHQTNYFQRLDNRTVREAGDLIWQQMEWQAQKRGMKLLQR